MSIAPGRDVQVMVAQGDGTSEVGKQLEEKGLIRDAQLFSIQKLLSQYEGDIQPGTYTLNTAMTAEEMFAVLLHVEEAEGEEGLEAAPLEESDTAPAAAPLEEGAEVNSPIDQTIPDEGDIAAEDTAEDTGAADTTEE